MSRVMLVEVTASNRQEIRHSGHGDHLRVIPIGEAARIREQVGQRSATVPAVQALKAHAGVLVAYQADAVEAPKVHVRRR